METLYSNEVRQFINTRDWPKGLSLNVTEALEPEPHLNLIFFRDNWLTLSREAQFKTTEVVKEIMAKLWDEGIPTYVAKMESRTSE